MPNARRHADRPAADRRRGDRGRAGGAGRGGVLAAGDAPNGAQPNTYVDATVTGVDTGSCDDSETGATTPCQVVSARLTSGPTTATRSSSRCARRSSGRARPRGGRPRWCCSTWPPARSEYRYSFADFQRRIPLLWLAAAFVVVVVAFGRWQGVRALLGLVASGAVLVAFVVPALLRD